MPPSRDPLSFLLGFLLGISTPLIMGCFASKPETVPSSAPQKVPPQPTSQSQPQSQPIPTPVSEPAVAASKVALVPKPAIQITAHDKASLKLRSLQDKLTAALSHSDSQLRLYGQEALRQHRAKNPIAAELLISERTRLQTKVARQQQEVARLAEMVDKMDEAKQNKDLFDALEKGNAMIADIMQDLTDEKVQTVLDQSREMKQAVQDVGDALAEDSTHLPQEQIDAEIAELEKEFGTDDTVQHETETLDKAQNIPDVPQVQPAVPQPATPQSAPEAKVPIAQG